MRINLSCAHCGRNRFAFPDAGGDEAIVTCDDCGHLVGTLGFLKEQVEQAVLGARRPGRRQDRASENDPLEADHG